MIKREWAQSKMRKAADPHKSDRVFLIPSWIFETQCHHLIGKLNHYKPNKTTSANWRGFFIESRIGGKLVRKFTTITVLVFFGVSAWGAESGVLIPSYVRNNINDHSDVATPARDLLYNGSNISSDEAFRLLATGEDISLLDPVETDIWKKTPPPKVDPTDYPTEVKFAAFQSTPSRFTGMFRAAVHPLSGDEQSYSLIVSLDVHGALLRTALLRHLGYPVIPPRYYQRLTVNFDTEKSKSDFLVLLADRTITQTKRWVVAETSTSITLQDLVLEPGRVLVPQYHWGAISPSTIQGRRALRALLLPLSLADTGESINKFSWEAGKIFNHRVTLFQTYADYFNETSYEDARWVLRKVAHISADTWSDIVKSAQFPPEVGELVLQKILSRRNHLLSLFRFKEFPPLPVNENFSSGAVKDGKVLTESFPGYGVRFAHGGLESPLRWSELLRFGKLEVLTKAIEKGLEYFNSALPGFKVDAIFEKHQEEMFDKFVQHLKTNGPLKPFSVPVGVWGGPIGDLGVRASRDVVSGTYYGVDSKVQLADSVTVRASLGWLAGFDGLKRTTPMASAQFGYQRSYVHVRPVPTISAADLYSWKKLFVPKFMSDLARNLDPNSSPEDMIKELSQFSDQFEENEILTIVDTLSFGANIETSLPILQLLGLHPGVPSNVGFGAAVSHVVVKRTTLRKTSSGFQVYVQNIKIDSLERFASFKFWMEVFRHSATNKLGVAETDFYRLDPEGENKIDVALALRGLLRSNSLELIQDRFSPVKLDHQTTSKTLKTKLFFKRWDKLEETHVVNARPAELPGINPDEHLRKFASHRIVRRGGNNYFDFASEIINSAAKGWGPGDATPGGDPGATPFGSSHMSGVRTESELTEGKENSAVTFIDSTWTGWSIKTGKLLKIVDELETKFSALKQSIGGPDHLVFRQALKDTQEFQLYELKATLFIYPRALDRLYQLLIENPSEQSVYTQLVNWFGKSELESWCRRIQNDFKNNGIQKYYGREGVYNCALPFMAEILDLRKSAGSKTSPLESLKTSTRLVDLLQSNLVRQNWMSIFKENEVFFIIRLSGFRTHDEAGYESYLSSTLGQFEREIGSGPFGEFSKLTGVMGYELNAQYFSEGF